VLKMNKLRNVANNLITNKTKGKPAFLISSFQFLYRDN